MSKDVKLLSVYVDNETGANPQATLWCTGWRCRSCRSKGRVTYTLGEVQLQDAGQHAEWVSRKVWDAHARTASLCIDRNQQLSKPYLATFPSRKAYEAAGCPDRPRPPGVLTGTQIA